MKISNPAKNPAPPHQSPCGYPILIHKGNPLSQENIKLILLFWGLYLQPGIHWTGAHGLQVERAVLTTRLAPTQLFAKGALSGRFEVKGNTKELFLIKNMEENLESFLT